MQRRKQADERKRRELRGQDLDVVPARQLRADHPHGRGRAVMAGAGQSVPGEFTELRVAIFRGDRMGVCVLSEVLVALKRLRVLLLQRGD